MIEYKIIPIREPLTAFRIQTEEDILKVDKLYSDNLKKVYNNIAGKELVIEIGDVIIIQEYGAISLCKAKHFDKLYEIVDQEWDGSGA